MWNLTPTARDLHDWIPEIGKLALPRAPCRSLEVKVIRLATGQTRLRQNMFRMNLEDSPLCPCNTAPQTIYHITNNCPLLHDSIKLLYENLDYLYCMNETAVHERESGLLNFVLPKHKDNNTRAAIFRLFCEFVGSLDVDKFKI